MNLLRVSSFVNYFSQFALPNFQRILVKGNLTFAQELQCIHVVIACENGALFDDTVEEALQTSVTALPTTTTT